ncbi:MarR family winged helix-turn-helix transcriptional regulator [Afifella sp. IM 167]|uniref:MarR family winged helix-turn-helix transcriptional regulator n=1 Tax=Afifella sp. IM 167 TaxID=2033586 RepID=UPI001CCE7910|nr:MarR family transcriptional regulator [Afifella sp. IM 167]MBZ8134894.1 MarR family transcriptional regulator [Afifella sp. IM 167]
MADIISHPRGRVTAARERAQAQDAEPVPASGSEADDIIELLFFAYRDFISDPDAILADFGFGRAHHRVLHFVDRHPGMRVADLLEILKITKQSLGRVLKQLIDSGFVEQQPGALDRRERLLFTTAQGGELAARLREPQSRRINDALAGLSLEARRQVAGFLLAMVNETEREDVAGRVYENERPRP